MPDSVRTTVVVVTWRGADHLGECLDALATQSREHRLVIVDNAADADTRRILAQHPVLQGVPEQSSEQAKVVRLPRNVGYAGGLAAVLPTIDTPLMAWLNDDACPDPNWLGAMEDALLANPDAAAISARLVDEDGNVRSTGVRIKSDGYGEDVQVPVDEPFGFCGGAAVVRTEVVRAVGGIPANFFCYYEDTDTSWRLRLAGWRILSEPTTRVLHRHGASTNHGSVRFHMWNERNRLQMLVRCAPNAVASRIVRDFVATTLALPFRSDVPKAANYRVGLRLRVLALVLLRLPWTVAERRRIGARSTVSRVETWRRWIDRY